MTTATKATWYAEPTAGGHQGLVACEKTGRTVALAYDPKDTTLLSAAPQLLEACQNAELALGMAGIRGGVRELLRAAIAAATK